MGNFNRKYKNLVYNYLYDLMNKINLITSGGEVMKQMNNFKKLLSLKLFYIVFVLTLLIIPQRIFAQDTYKTFAAQQNVSLNKIWNIKFSDNINPSTANKDNIKIVDDKGTSLDLNISCSGNIVTLKPVSNYEDGKAYTIYINNIKSTKGSDLKTPAMMNFTTKGDTNTVLDAGKDSYNLVDVHTYKITDSLTITSSAATKFNLNYNIGTISNSPYQKEVDLKVSGQDAQITSKDEEHKQLTVNSYVESGKTLQYQVVRTVTVGGIKYIKDLSKTSGDYSGFSDYSKYTSPEEKIESNSQEIINKSKELFNNITNPYYKAKKAYEFVNSYMNYDLASGNEGALNAIRTGKGVCEDYAELFAALLRASGVPVRMVTGYWIDPSQLKVNNAADISKYRHAWAEYYLPEYGWIVVEPTNAYYDNGIRTLDFSYFSNLDSSDHIIQGYTAYGDDKDSTLYYSYSQGSGFNIDKKTTIEMLDK